MREEDIPELKLTTDNCVGATFALYGPTKSGKTIYTKYIMNLINSPIINQALVVSPTEPSNREYTGCVPSPAIWYRIRAPEGADLGKKAPDSPEGKMMFLSSIIHRQTMATGLFREHNSLDKLIPLTKWLPPKGKKEMESVMEDLDRRTRAAIHNVKRTPNLSPDRRQDIINKYNTLFEDVQGRIYKSFFNKYMKDIWHNPKLQKSEKKTLYYMNTNPNLLTVWDDCAASIKSLFRKEQFREMFYQPRHLSLTNIFTFQDNTDLEKNLRKQPFFSILCNAEVARGFFETTGFGKEEKNLALSMIPIIFGRDKQKMVYVRDDPKKFYRISVEKVGPFRFGSPSFWEISDQVSRDSHDQDTNNPYFNRFDVHF